MHERTTFTESAADGWTSPYAGRPPWPVAFLIISGTAPINFALAVPRPILGGMAKAIGHGPADDLLVKMVISIIGLAVVIGAPLSGFLLKRVGHRVIMTTALALVVITGCMPYFLNDLRYIVAGRFLLGMSVAALQVSAVTLIAEVYPPKDRAKMVGMMMAGAAAAAFALSPVAGWIGEFGWRAPFLLHLVLIPSIFFAATSLPKRSFATVPISEPAKIGRSWRQFPFALAGLGLIAGASMILPPVYLAFRLREIGVLSPAVIGASYMAISVPETIASSCYGFFRKHISVSAMNILGFVVTAVGLAITGFTSVYLVLLIGMMLFGIGMALVYPSTMERASADTHDRSRAVSLVISTIFVSLVIGTFALEPVYLRVGANGVLICLAGMCVLMALLLARKMLTGRSPVASPI